MTRKTKPRSLKAKAELPPYASMNTKIQHNKCGAGVGQLVVLSDPAMLNVSSYKAALAPNINCPVGTLSGADRSLKTDEHVARHGPVRSVFSSEELG